MKRWRNEPNETGLRRVCQGPRGLELREGRKVLVRVGWMRNDRWHWYGFGRNSLREPEPRDFATREEAKADAIKSLAAELSAPAESP